MALNKRRLESGRGDARLGPLSSTINEDSQNAGPLKLAETASSYAGSHTSLTEPYGSQKACIYECGRQQRGKMQQLEGYEGR